MTRGAGGNLAFLVLFLVAVVASIVPARQDYKEAEAACQQRGGVLVKGGGGYKLACVAAPPLPPTTK